jgi:putative N6-adenine-specific DNA methylase
MGLSVSDSGYGRVHFRADTTGLYRTLMGLRAADRVLLETGFFPAADFDALFAGTQNVSWEKFIPAQKGLKITKVRTNRSKLQAETSIQAIVNKAAAKRLCTAYGLERLPETGAEAEVRVYIEKDTVSLLLDLSGTSLFKRGYRIEGGIAPLRETTAAAMLLLSGWKRKYPLYDPFCGSGTILAEALMYAWDMAPGLGRRFAISDLLIADAKIEETVREEFRSRINFDRLIRIAGSDSDAPSAQLAEKNLQRVMDITKKNTALPSVKVQPFQSANYQQSDYKLPTTDRQLPTTPGFIVTNPPYGNRLGSPEESEKIYREMAVLEGRFPGWKLVVITDHPGFESFFGRKADSCREISNGPIPSYIFQYERL